MDTLILQMRNWGMERLTTLPKVIQLLSGRCKTWNQFCLILGVEEYYHNLPNSDEMLFHFFFHKAFPWIDSFLVWILSCVEFPDIVMTISAV